MDKFFYFLDVTGLNLEIKRYHNQDGRFTAKIEDSWIKEGAVIEGVYGNGKSANNAIIDYMVKISGKTLVTGAYTKNRKEYQVPKF